MTRYWVTPMKAEQVASEAGVSIGSHSTGSDQMNPTDNCNTHGPILSIDLVALASLIAEKVIAAVSEQRECVESQWTDVPGAAKHLACSVERVRKLIQRREIPFHQERSGGRVFLNRKEMDEWLLRQ
jgi:excisionase family DNA binding protein